MNRVARPKQPRGWKWGVILLPPLLMLWGCSTTHYRKKADEAAYRIIQQVEQNVFGKTNEFTIDTRYSQRDPQEISPEEIIADRNATNRVTLTISDALELAVENSRQYQTEKERLYLTALTLTGQRHEFTPQWFADSTITGTRFSNGERQGSVFSRVGLSQALKSGASIGVSLANDLLRYYTGDPRKSAISTISLNVLQPLLRGAGSKIVAEQLTQAERNVIYGIRDYTHFQNTFAVDIVNDYFNLLALKDRVYNQYNNYTSRTNTTIYLTYRAQDREKPLDVEQAKQNELSAKSTYINAIVAYDNALDRFKTTLGIPNGTDVILDDTAFDELEDTGPLPVNVDKNSAFQIALEHYLPLMNEIDRFEDSKRKIIVAADRLNPDLNIFADATVDSQEPTNYTDFDFDKIRTNIGIELNLPLDRLRERNDYRATLIDFESELRNLGLALDNLKNTIDLGIRDLERLRLNYDIAKESVAIAEKRKQGTELEYQAGLTLLRNVIDAQDDLISSQNAATEALVSYVSARLDLLLNLGILNTEIEKFWLRPEAATVDLSKPVERRRVGFEGDQVIPPDEIFTK